MNDTALVIYSRTGTTRLVARLLSDRLDCPIFEITDQVSRAGVMGDLRCVLDNVFRRDVAYCYTGPALDDYRKLVVMAPVWVGHLAAPMRCFLREHRHYGQKLAGIAVMASSGGFRAAEEIATIMGCTPSPVLVLSQRDIVSGNAQADLDGFAAALEQAPTVSTTSPRPAWLSPNEA